MEIFIFFHIYLYFYLSIYLSIYLSRGRRVVPSTTLCPTSQFLYKQVGKLELIRIPNYYLFFQIFLLFYVLGRREMLVQKLIVCVLLKILKKKLPLKNMFLSNPLPFPVNLCVQANLPHKILWPPLLRKIILPDKCWQFFHLSITISFI